jgi:hypothetical protein
MGNRLAARLNQKFYIIYNRDNNNIVTDVEQRRTHRYSKILTVRYVCPRARQHDKD